MKKLVVLFISVFSLSLGVVSCSDDDNGGGSIVGKWEYSKEGVSANGQEILLDYEHNAIECGKDYVEFLENDTYRDVYYYQGITGCETGTQNATYTKSGKNITITIGSETIEGTIVSLSGSTLKVKYPETVDGQTINSVIVFTKA
jgi:hypothetical protein